MAEHDYSIANQAGAALRSDLNNVLAAIVSQNSKATAPTTTFAYEFWADTTANLLKQRNAANSGWLVRGSLAETFVIARSSDTVLAASDQGKSFVATSTFSQTLTAAATLGDGWYCDYRNDGTGVVTIDPNGVETIDGLTTLPLQPGNSCKIVCNGSSFKTIGLTSAPKVGLTSRALDAASGSQAITGVGFKPRLILLLVSCGTFNDLASWGFTDGTTTANIFRSVSTFQSGTPGLITITNGTWTQEAVLASLDADGFTLTWTKSGSPSSATVTISYIAIR